MSLQGERVLREIFGVPSPTAPSRGQNVFGIAFGGPTTPDVCDCECYIAERECCPKCWMVCPSNCLSGDLCRIVAFALREDGGLCKCAQLE